MDLEYVPINFISDFRSKYEKRETNIEDERKFLEELADDYLRRDGCWANIVQAHTLYNCCYIISADERCLQKAYSSQEIFWKSKNLAKTMTFEKGLWLTAVLKEKLTAIREEVKNSLRGLQTFYAKFECDFEKLKVAYDESTIMDFCRNAKLVFEQCNSLMTEFFSFVISQAVELCGPPHCRFATVGIGSLAKGECSPYSDFEYLFLLENGAHPKEYFENLAITSYFLIGNLAETKLKTMDISEIFDWYRDPTKTGCKIDGLQKHAGNIPTGNGYPDQHNKFICTVDELLNCFKKVFNNPNECQTEIADVTAMLSSTVFVYGDKDLLADFETGRNSLTPNSSRSKVTMQTLHIDLKNYRFRPDDDFDKVFFAKQDLFRFPSLLVHNLKAFFSLESSKSYEIVDELSMKELICASWKLSILLLLSTAQFIRLSAYVHHNSQKDDISILQEYVNETPSFSNVKVPWHVPYEIVLHMSLHLLSVKSCLITFEDKITLHKILTFDFKAAAVIVSYCSKKYEQFLKEVINIDWDNLTNQDKVRFKFMHFYVATILFRDQEASELAKYFDQILSKIKFDDHLFGIIQATQYMMNGTKAFIAGNNSEALTHFKGAISLYTKFNAKYIGHATALSNLGNVLVRLEKFPEAEEAYLQSLKKYEDIYGFNVLHESIADCYLVLGNVCVLQKKFPEAEGYFVCALKMYEQMDYHRVGKEVIKGCYYNLANLYIQQGKVDEFQKYIKLAEELKS